MDRLTLAILAGGKSSRMGTDKAFVPILGRPMIEHILTRLAGIGHDETLIITNEPKNYVYLNLPTYTDLRPGKGALGGIYTALYHSSHNDVVVVACDMPFVQPDLLRYMSDLRTESTDAYDVIVPRVAGYPQGTHAIYRTTCLNPIQERLAADRLKIIGFYDHVRVRYLDEPERHAFDPKGLSFFNANTPDDLAHARQLVDEKE